MFLAFEDLMLIRSFNKLLKYNLKLQFIIFKMEREKRLDDSPVRDRDDSEEENKEESAVDRQIRELNVERRKHLIKKEQISKKIESKTRELNFLKGLDSDDVIYMMYKKDVYAAKIIQRWWRIRKMKKIFSIKTKERIKEIKAAMMIQKYWRLQKRRKYLRYYQKHNTKRIDHFYDPIPDDLLKIYEEKIKSRVRTFSTAELGDKPMDQLEREYISKYREFYDNYIENEHLNLKWSLIIFINFNFIKNLIYIKELESKVNELESEVRFIQNNMGDGTGQRDGQKDVSKDHSQDVC